jgi:hypothetical protein
MLLTQKIILSLLPSLVQFQSRDCAAFCFCYTDCMSWAARRRLFILLIIGVVFVGFLSVILIATFTEVPSCTDSISNQGEAGVDCGGPCPYLCVADVEAPIVLFTKALPNTLGRTDSIAMIENKNLHAAAAAVPYRLSLFGENQSLIQEVTGTVDLPPGTRVPVYVPGILSGNQTVSRAFLSLPETPRWFALSQEEHIIPNVGRVTQSGIEENPRIEAILNNPTTEGFFQTLVVVMVRDSQGTVLAASQTVVPIIPPQGEAPAIFTWNRAFTATPSVIEVVPIIPLTQ